MLKSCSKCGKIHPYDYKCNVGKTYNKDDSDRLRNKSAWRRKREEVKEKANYLCEVCKTRGVFTYEGLEVHHIHKLRSNQDRLLDNYNLITLCVECHKKADRGEIQAVYLEDLARKREQGTPPVP